MHAFETEKCRIHYNSDVSGNCIIVNKEDESSIEIPAEDILDFTAHIVKSIRTGKIINMSTNDILGI